MLGLTRPANISLELLLFIFKYLKVNCLKHSFLINDELFFTFLQKEEVTGRVNPKWQILQLFKNLISEE